MIAAELTERRLVQLKQNLPQLLGFGIAGCETLPVNLSQRADEGVSVFGADFAILVAVAIIETCLAHAAPPCAAADSILRPRLKRNLKVGPCRQLPHVPSAKSVIARIMGDGSAESTAMPGRGV